MRARVVPPSFQTSCGGARSRHALTGGGAGVRQDLAPHVARTKVKPNPGSQETNKGKRNAGRRVVQPPHRRMRLPPPNLPRDTAGTEGGSPSGVPPRHLRQRPNATAQLQLTRFLRRISLGTGVTRSLPSQCSGFPRRPVVVPAGRIDPEPPGNGGDAPARGNRSRPASRCHPAGVLWGARWELCN